MPSFLSEIVILPRFLNFVILPCLFELNEEPALFREIQLTVLIYGWINKFSHVILPLFC